jgi:4-hydroxy-2-oxoglutarate aldolase
VALRRNDLHQTPIIAGVGATSTRETIHLAEDAAASGANFALVVLPSYYASTLRAQPKAVKQYFVDVASKSPLPVYVLSMLPILSDVNSSGLRLICAWYH